MKCRYWVCLFAGASFLGGYIFSDIPIDRLLKASEGLFSAAMALFAILGVWIAVLDPTRMLDKKPGEDMTKREQLAQDLLHPWIGAIVVFGLTFVFQFGAHLFLVGNIPLWVAYSCRVVVVFLFLMNIYVLWGTVLPVYRLQYVKRENKMREEYRK